MANTSPQGLAKQLLVILSNDHSDLFRLDDYLHGRQDTPYMPENADAEYRMLAERCITNVMRLASRTPSQAMYVDAFRRGDSTDGATPEMDHWQRSRMDARQIAVHNAAFDYGHSFVVTTKATKGRDKGKPISRGLSPLKTAALFEDPANDIEPYAALTVTEWPKGDEPGEAILWDITREYALTFTDFGPEPKVSVQEPGKLHGATECPVTRFAPLVDLDGRTVSVIGPLMELQDRINQSVFDLLVAQTGGSFKVRYASGMAPPMMRDPETGKIILDENGQPRPAPINHNAKKMMFSADPAVRFGQLDETPLNGYIEAIEMAFRHFSAIAQVPPHHLLGQIANLSAEALQAAETSLLRLIEQFKTALGECWERVFRLAAELTGDTASAEDFRGEVIWRDMEQKSLAQSADALGKLKDQLDIPAQGLWPRIPGATTAELQSWKDMADAEPDVMLADAVTRASATGSQLRTQPAVASDLPATA